MEKKYIVALDQGTTSSRAVVFDSDQKIVGVAQKEFTQIYPKEGWVEHDPMEIWSTSRMTDRPNIWSHKKGSEIKTFPRAGTTWFVSILNRFILLYMPLIYIIFHNKPKFFAVFHFKSFFSQILWLFLFGENT